MWWQIILCVVIFVLVRRRWKLRKFLRLERHIKSKMPQLPLLGHAHHFFANHEVHMQVYAKFAKEAMENGGINSLWIGDNLFIGIVDPVLAEILTKFYLEKGDVMRFMKYVTGNGSIFAPVSIWRPRRKIMAPTFKPRNLYNFSQIFAKQTSVMLNLISANIGKGVFSIWPYITNYAMDSIVETTLGVDINYQKNRGHYALKALKKICYLLAKRLVEPWSYNDVMYKLNPDSKKLSKCRDVAHGFVNKIIQSKKEAIKNDLQPKNNSDKEKCLRSFLEILIDTASGEECFSDIELMEEILVIVAAGTDTSASGAAFISLLLAQHQDIQEKVFEELKDVFGDSDRHTEPEDIPRLKYLDAVIKESLRLYPPVPIVVRRADKDFTLPSGLTIVEGCTIAIHIWGIHRNPKYWGPDVDQFRPERFFEPLKHPAQFIAFSYGSRNCLGSKYAMISLKTTFSMLLRRFRLLPASPSTNESKDHKPFRVKFDIMLKDVDNYMLQVEERT